MKRNIKLIHSKLSRTSNADAHGHLQTLYINFVLSKIYKKILTFFN
ncbi:unnamed protein product [Ixodes persulcatus]